MKGRSFILLVLLVLPGILGCTVVVTEAALPTPTKATALRRLGLSEKGTSTVVLEQVLRGTGQPNESSVAAVLETFVDGEMGLRGVAPAGWRVLGRGIRVRDEVTRIVITFKDGVPTQVENLNDGTVKTGALELFTYLNQLGRQNGIGRFHNEPVVGSNGVDSHQAPPSGRGVQ